MAHIEAFLVVFRVDEPGGDAFGVAGADFADLGIEHVHADDADLDVVGLAGDGFHWASGRAW